MIIDASSHEELAKTLAGLPFWSRLTWNVTPLESYRPAIERGRMAMENLKHKQIRALRLVVCSADGGRHDNKLQIGHERKP